MPHLCTTVLVLATLQILPAADWKDKPFPNWSDDAIVHLVADSPWAKPKTIRINWTKNEDRKITYKDIPGADHSKARSDGGSPVGGIGAPKSTLPDRSELIIRWASALPVRQAKALYKQRDEKLDPAKLDSLIAQPEPDYVIEIYGVPAVVAHQGTGTIELLVQRSAYLQTKKGRTIRPNRVEVSLHALTMTIFVHFPRTEPIQQTDSEVDFGADLQLFHVEEKFKLSSMKYMGNLEL
jgi:hypothetical protein